MENIKVGEYVRTKNGKIDKVINNNCYMQQYIECEKSLLYKEDIVNYSKDLIDLLELGDIIEIELSEEFVEKEDKKILTQIGEVYTKETLQIDIDNGIIRKILTILTKEQYTQNCYTIDTN